MRPANLFQHHPPGIALGGAVGLEKLRRHDPPVAVLHQQVAGVTQLGFLAAAFARQQRIQIGGRLMRWVGPCLALKIKCSGSRDRPAGSSGPCLESSSGWPRLR